MAGGFRSNIFDPLLIVAQIVAMQCSFYAFMGLWILLADIVGGIQPSVDQLLDYRVSFYLCKLYCVREGEREREGWGERERERKRKKNRERERLYYEI